MSHPLWRRWLKWLGERRGVSPPVIGVTGRLTPPLAAPKRLFLEQAGGSADAQHARCQYEHGSSGVGQRLPGVGYHLRHTQPVTLIATVSAQSGTAAPTLGSVDFLDVTANLELGVINTATVAGTNAIFQLVTTPSELQVIQASGGVHAISALYTRVNGFNGSFTSLNQGLTVSPALLTITAVANTKVYNSTINATAVPSVSGLIGGDSVTGLAEVYSDGNARFEQNTEYQPPIP